ncbi:hypothetical protein [Paenibacillus sp. O199]|uniref:hypothetical protein n=1 Tax=Paenibacillus sp. O199 TaxID=1643925 RepID=UPI0007BEF12E|nr:hypothetical protein [Paenibacillus sp. O199]
MDATVLTAILSSSVIAAIISGIVAKKTNDKNMSLKYITEERANWRKTVKENTALLYNQIYSKDQDEGRIRELITHLIVSLNPSKDEESKLDIEIKNTLVAIEEGNRDYKMLEHLRNCISILMKHDWERSKNETKGFGDKKSEDDIKQQTLGEEFYVKQKKQEMQ